MSAERFLVTGALGCIGAWTCALLAEEGVEVVGFDFGTDDRRLRLATDAEIPLVQGDIVDGEAFARLLDEHGITHVIHLAALLLPQIKPDPPYGTAVNIGGTVNVLDAAKTRGIQVAYASSAAVYSNRGRHRRRRCRTTRSATRPRSTACTSRRARGWRGSSGTRSRCRRSASGPFIVYGPGRDNGLTASPTLAMAAAAAGEDYRITFGGRTQLQYAPDTARVFIAAARAATEDARVFHLGGPVVSLAEVAAAIEAAVPERLDHRRRGHDPAVPGGVRRRAARRGARRRSTGRRSQEGVSATVERLRAVRA